MPDGKDFDPLDSAIKLPRVPKTSYAVIDLTALGFKHPTAFNDSLQILDQSDSWPYNIRKIWNQGTFSDVPASIANSDGTTSNLYWQQSCISNSGQILYRTIIYSPTGITYGVWSATSGFESLTYTPPEIMTDNSGYYSELTFISSGGKNIVGDFSGIANDWSSSYAAGLIWKSGASTPTRVGNTGHITWDSSGTRWFSPLAVNDNGVVAGFTRADDGAGTPEAHPRAALWQDGAVVPLSQTTNPNGDNASSVNNSDPPVAAGYVWNSSDPSSDDISAMMWLYINSQWTPKHVMKCDGNGGRTPVQGGCNQINDRGEIIGQVVDDDYNVAPLFSQNGLVVKLEEQVPSKDFYDYFPYALNNKGAMLATAKRLSDNKEVYVLLLPVELMVDGDRDGKMDAKDAAIHNMDLTSADRPYRFWVNNNHDGSHTVDGNDTEEDDLDDFASHPDYSTNRLSCKRDLEDWARLWVSCRGITNLVKAPNVTLQLEWKPDDDSAGWQANEGNPSVKLVRHVSDGGAGDLEATYLTNTDKANSEIQNEWAGIMWTVSKGSPAVLPANLINTLSEDHPTLFFLFEGATAGKGKLVVTVQKDGQTIAEYPPVYLELKDVKDMYERWTVGDVRNAGVDYTSNTWPAALPIQCQSPSKQTLPAPTTDEEKDYIVFVHGWNMSPNDKDFFSDTAFKRLWWQGYKGRFGAFRWPTFWFQDGNNGLWGPGSVHLPILGYIPDPHNFDGSEERAWNSATGLLNLLNQLNSGAFSGRVRMIAHSMGNVVASEALRQSGSQAVHTYVASQAALPAHCYDATAPLMVYSSGLGPTTPNVYGYYWQNGVASQPHQWQSEGRPSYMHTNYMNGKAGRYFNYYNDADWALTWPRWEADQQAKPDTVYGYEYAGSGTARGFGRDRAIGATWLTFPSNTYEIFAWAAESRSYALGGQWVGGVVTGSTGVNRDLRQSPISYQQQHKYHSGEFRGTNMERYPYWQQLLIDCGLKVAE